MGGGCGECQNAGVSASEIIVNCCNRFVGWDGWGLYNPRWHIFLTILSLPGRSARRKVSLFQGAAVLVVRRATQVVHRRACGLPGPASWLAELPVRSAMLITCPARNRADLFRTCGSSGDSPGVGQGVVPILQPELYRPSRNSSRRARRCLLLGMTGGAVGQPGQRPVFRIIHQGPDVYGQLMAWWPLPGWSPGTAGLSEGCPGAFGTCTLRNGAGETPDLAHAFLPGPA